MNVEHLIKALQEYVKVNDHNILMIEIVCVINMILGIVALLAAMKG